MSMAITLLIRNFSLEREKVEYDTDKDWSPIKMEKYVLD